MSVNLPKYLSLKNAAELYGYTRDHLGLMIRKGRLKGAKLGSYYVTTNDWMVEYVKNFSDINHPVSKNKLSNRFLADVLAAENKTKTEFTVKNNKNLNVNHNVDKNQNLASPQIELKTDFEKKISEELSKLKPSSGYPLQNDNVYADSNKKNTDSGNYGLKTNDGYPYVVLPIREMENIEREVILNKIGAKEDKQYLA